MGFFFWVKRFPALGSWTNAQNLALFQGAKAPYKRENSLRSEVITPAGTPADTTAPNQSWISINNPLSVYVLGISLIICYAVICIQPLFTQQCVPLLYSNPVDIIFPPVVVLYIICLQFGVEYRLITLALLNYMQWNEKVPFHFVICSFLVFGHKVKIMHHRGWFWSFHLMDGNVHW